jgi:hypothetical protein
LQLQVISRTCKLQQPAAALYFTSSILELAACLLVPKIIGCLRLIIINLDFFFAEFMQTNDAQNDNLYPYVHLLPNNQLFIFANRDSILFDWTTNSVVANLPTIPGEPRNYPSAGSSAMLPLSGFNGWADAEILLCGGSTYGAFLNPAAALPASITCGRISPLDAAPAWAMENMPMRRNMGDMLLLPDRNVLIVNGAGNGAQGWGFAQNPVQTPVLYNPNAAAGTRFQTLTATDIPRVYHSTANVLPDGRVLIAGSNTHQFYTLTGYLPTELRIEAFSPPYLGGAQPTITDPPAELAYGQAFAVTVAGGNPLFIDLNLLSAAYSTHSFSQVRLSMLCSSRSFITCFCCNSEPSG